MPKHQEVPLDRELMILQINNCEECKFADRKALFHAPCCTYPGKIIETPDGRCTARRKITKTTIQ